MDLDWVKVVGFVAIMRKRRIIKKDKWGIDRQDDNLVDRKRNRKKRDKKDILNRSVDSHTHACLLILSKKIMFLSFLNNLNQLIM